MSDRKSGNVYNYIYEYKTINLMIIFYGLYFNNKHVKLMYKYS